MEHNQDRCDDSNIPSTKNLKRKLEINDNEISKRKRTDGSILDFPDDILLIILSKLTHNNIIALSKTCERLNRVCQDHTLWRDITFPNATSKEELDFTLNNVGVETKSLVSFGYNDPSPGINEFRSVLTNKWMVELCEKCPNLKYLSLHHHFLDCKEILINDFPSTLTKLDLSSTCFKNEPCGRSYFRDISKYIPELEVLILSNCNWFEPHSLMALSKCPKLLELRLDGCVQIKDCVAYCGLATRGGFKSLKTLDLRKCPIGSSELICFASVTSLINLYLQNPNYAEPPKIDSPILILFTNGPMIEIRADGHAGNINYPRLKIERLIIQNYFINGECLVQLAKDALHLKYLDISGSRTTGEARCKFQQMRPDVQFIDNTRYCQLDCIV